MKTRLPQIGKSPTRRMTLYEKTMIMPNSRWSTMLTWNPMSNPAI
jgi:hypothetical protein